MQQLNIPLQQQCLLLLLNHGTGAVPLSANNPEVKASPPPVTPKPKRGQPQTAIEESAAAPEPKQLDLYQNGHKNHQQIHVNQQHQQHWPQK